MSNLDLAARAMREADALLITAGAGMGVDSGLPDFRGNEGFWKAYPPLQNLGISFAQMANPCWFKDDPELAWGFYGHRLNLYRRTQPHQGFEILWQWCRQKTDGSFVFTSNVDGHFQKAGFGANSIMEVHGSINHLQCTAPCSHNIWSADDVQIAVDEATFRAAPPLPLCPSCGKLARPNILMFNDYHWISTRTDEQRENLNTWLQQISGCKLTVIECGAGTAIPTVRRLGETLQQIGAQLIRINTREADGPLGTISIGASTQKSRSNLPRGAMEALWFINERRKDR